MRLVCQLLCGCQCGPGVLVLLYSCDREKPLLWPRVMQLFDIVCAALSHLWPLSLTLCCPQSLVAALSDIVLPSVTRGRSL